MERNERLILMRMKTSHYLLMNRNGQMNVWQGVLPQHCYRYFWKNFPRVYIKVWGRYSRKPLKKETLIFLTVQTRINGLNPPAESVWGVPKSWRATQGRYQGAVQGGTMGRFRAVLWGGSGRYHGVVLGGIGAVLSGPLQSFGMVGCDKEALPQLAHITTLPTSRSHSF